jgi:hypothetical protein
MIELNAEIPFLWRLGAESSDGYCSVSLVVPCPPETSVEDLTIETSVLSLASDSLRSEQEETLEWNEEDISLFLRLLNQRRAESGDPHAMEAAASAGTALRVDLGDPDVIDIIHIVAAAGFGVAFTSTGLLRNPEALLPAPRFDIGSKASLDTIAGFKQVIVVDIDDDDVVCVLTQEIDVQAIDSSADEYDKLLPNDLLLVQRCDILHPDYAESRGTPSAAIVH